MIKELSKNTKCSRYAMIRLGISSVKYWLLFAFIALPNAAKATGGTNEIWISALSNAYYIQTSNYFGNGALTNPYYGDFDYIVNQQPTNSTIHLLPGVFETKGNQGFPDDLYLISNQKVIGAGIDVTVVQRSTSYTGYPGDRQCEVVDSLDDGVEISDLTIDAAANGTEAKAKSGLVFTGNKSAIRRVKIINCSGNSGNSQECFPIAIGALGTIGNIVSECEVSSVLGSACSAISFEGQVSVTGNRVLFSGSEPYNAYNSSGTVGCEFRGNYCDGGGSPASGFYTDTFGETNLVISENCFRNVQQGITVVKQPNYGWLLDGISIIHNTIEMSTNLSSLGGTAIDINNQDTTGNELDRNIFISGNTIRYYNEGSLTSGAGPVYVLQLIADAITNLVNVRVVHNTFDRSFSYNLYNGSLYMAGSGYLFSDNTDLLGVPC
jgi:hypothetical protein